MPTTVFVIQDDGRKNLSPALEFGEVKVLSTRDVSLYADNTRVFHALRAKLVLFNPGKDYLLLTGDPILIGMAMAIVMRDHQECRCLKWDRQERRYIPILIKMPVN